MSILIWSKRIVIFGALFFLIDFGISELLLKGLNKYFGLHSNAKMLVNGSSMSLAGFNKAEIESASHKSIAFYARNGVSLEDRNTMLEHYFDTTTQKTEIVILEVNPLLFSKRFTAANVYMLFLPFMDEPSMEGFIKSKTTFKDYWVRKLVRTSRYNVDLFSVSLKGYLGMYENKKTQILDANSLEGLKGQVNSVPVEFDADKVALLKKTIALVEKNSKKIILVNMPIFESKMKTFKYDEYQVFISFIKKYAQSHHNILFLDLNQQQITSDPKLFSDPLHVNDQGQIKVSETLIQFIAANGLDK